MTEMGRDWTRRPVERRHCATAPFRRSLVLFDLDGTLIDSAPDICDIMADAFLAAGETPPEDAEVRALIGLSQADMVTALTKDMAADVRQKILCGYRLRYFDLLDDIDVLPVYPGAAATLHLLSRMGFAMGVATGKAQHSASRLLSEMNCLHHFHTLQCADSNVSKPAPSMVYRAMLETGRNACETILVGDSRYDMQMARAAGITAIGVSWGYTSVPDLLREGASAIAGNFDQLIDMLTCIDAGQNAVMA